MARNGGQDICGQSGETSVKYRSEIDGLRALAVIPVILFHAGFTSFRGGFVGVDVFFVISGYLITSLILEDLDNGNFSLARFYDRRARRILPALFFVVACSIPLAWAILLPKDLTDFLNSVIAVSVFSSNILFWFQSGYFDAGADVKPLLHTWSLAVEEQFYILFPLLMMLLWRRARGAINLCLWGLLLISLGFAQWASENAPEFGFFLLPARAWELLIGAMAAIYLLRHPRPAASVTSNLLSVAGLLAITYAVFEYNQFTPFPSIHALAPTVGTVLIILFAVPGTWVHKLLSLKACVAIGLISYSLYLWHQPVFVFARYVFGLPHGSNWFWPCIAVSFALAIFSWRFIERPFRRGTFNVTRVLSGAAVASVAVCLAGFGLSRIENPTVDELDYGTHWSGWTACYPFGTREEAGGGCRILDPDRAPTFVVVGDSHAGHLASGLRARYADTDENPMVLLSGGCYPTVSRDTPYKNFMTCDQDFMDKAIAYVIDLEAVKRVVISGYGNLEILRFKPHHGITLEPDELDARQALLQEGLHETISLFLEAGKRLLFLSDTPEFFDHPAQCSTRFAAFTGTCPRYVPRTEVDDRSVRIDAIVETLPQAFPDLEIFDGRSAFCDDTVCVSGTETTNWFQTHNHLTPAGSIMLVEKAFQDF